MRKDGTRFWASVIITAVRDGRGSLRGFAKVTRDLTERRRAEAALQQEASRRSDAEQTSKLAQLFIAVLGHDLRNPLSAIITSAGYLGRIATSEKQGRTISRIASSGARMGRMIEQLLDITRVGLGGGITLDCRPGDLAEICRNVVDELSTVRPDSQVRCQFVGDTCGEWDVTRIEQVISNLVGNALAHGTPGMPVSLRLDGNSDRMLLTLHNGGAIPPALLPQIFEAFARDPSSAGKASSGLGLGLYISAEIVRAHGGEIEVRSNETEGTSFLVSLPRRCGPQPNEAS